MSRIVVWLAPVAYMLFVLALSSIPGEAVEGAEQPPLWWLPSVLANLLHVPLYAGLAAVWCVTLTFTTSWSMRRIAWTAFGLATLFGVVDELYQGFTPGRSPSLDDVVMNAIGAALGAAAFQYLRRRMRDYRS